MMTTQNTMQRGQSVVEYAILVGAVVLAGMVMAKFVTRAASARVHDSYASQIDGGGLVNFTTEQYEPYYNSGTVNSAQDGSVSDAYANGATTRGGNRHANESGTRNVDAAGSLGADDQWLQ